MEVSLKYGVASTKKQIELGFNPLFNGSVSEVCNTPLLHTENEKSFNPLFNGSVSEVNQRILCLLYSFSVSILCLMEVSLKSEGVSSWKKRWESFNPLFNGSVSEVCP